MWWYWELHWNIVGGYTKGKNSIAHPPPIIPLPKREKKNWALPSVVHVEPSHRVHEFFISKTICHHSQHGLGISDVHESIVTKEIAHENKGLGAFFLERSGGEEKRRR